MGDVIGHGVIGHGVRLDFRTFVDQREFKTLGFELILRQPTELKRSCGGFYL